MEGRRMEKGRGRCCRRDCELGQDSVMGSGTHMRLEESRGEGPRRLTQVVRKDGDSLGTGKNEFPFTERGLLLSWLGHWWRVSGSVPDMAEYLVCVARGKVLGSGFGPECNSEPLYFLSRGTCCCNEKMNKTDPWPSPESLPSSFLCHSLLVFALEWIMAGLVQIPAHGWEFPGLHVRCLLPPFTYLFRWLCPWHRPQWIHFLFTLSEDGYALYVTVKN